MGPRNGLIALNTSHGTADTSTNESLDQSIDEQFMRIACELARRGEGLAEPNPMVGCLIVRDGQVVGRGYHKQYGGPHAEVQALRSLESPSDAKGATAYVTLEPCCHHGKTPPCSNALAGAGLARIVVAIRDPFPRVDGGGIQQLRDASIDVTVGVLASEAEQICAPYLKRVRTGLPWVIAKWAMTIDGRIATATGQSQWITGESARANVHRLRSRVDAIAVGMGTVAADDPMLTARVDDQVSRVASRVVFCRHRVPDIDSKLVKSANETPLLLVAGPQIAADLLSPLQEFGAEIIEAATDDPIEMVRVGLAKMGAKQMTNVMLEGGGELIGSFFATDQIDECHVYIGAKVFGGQDALGPIGGAGISRISNAWTGRLCSLDQFDNDLLAVYRRF